MVVFHLIFNLAVRMDAHSSSAGGSHASGFRYDIFLNTEEYEQLHQPLTDAPQFHSCLKKM